MSNRLHRLPISTDILSLEECQEIIKGNKDIHIYHERYIYPRRVDRFTIDVNNCECSIEEYDKMFNKNYIMEHFIPQFMEKNFNASIAQKTIKKYNYKIFVDEKLNYAYFYTINIYKRTKAKKYFDNHKAFFINVYQIPYKIFDMFELQDNAYYLFNQTPSGFKFDKIEL